MQFTHSRVTRAAIAPAIPINERNSAGEEIAKVSRGTCCGLGHEPNEPYSSLAARARGRATAQRRGDACCRVVKGCLMTATKTYRG